MDPLKRWLHGAESQPPQISVFLICQLVDGELAHVELPQRPFTIGRSPEVDLQISDRSISRIHCGIRPDGDDYRIRDLGSRNGTWLNGLQIQDSDLRIGDQVRLGHLELTLERAPRGRPMAEIEVADPREALTTTSRIPNLPHQ